MFDDQISKDAGAPPNLPIAPDDMFAGIESGAAPAGAVGEESAPPSPDAIAAGKLRRKEATSPSPVYDASAEPILPPPLAASGTMYSMKEPVLGKIIVGLLLLLVLGSLGYGGWWLYANYYISPGQTSATKTATTTKKTTPVSSQPVVVPATAQTPVQPTVPVVPTTTTAQLGTEINAEKVLFGQPIDTDHDGLDDVREKTVVGTNPNNPDTDGDGLTDGEEVILYKTNPFIKDTDSDGLTDGDEVKKWKTDPLNPDSDSDGFLDGVEVKNGYNPLGAGKLSTSTVSAATAANTVKK